MSINGGQDQPANAVLKDFLDLTIAKGVGGEENVASLSLLLASVYGSSGASIRDVQQYIAQQIGPEAAMILEEVQSERLRDLALRSDKKMAKLLRKEGALYTGFHRYDIEKRVWQKV